jgi:hypothetical protein
MRVFGASRREAARRAFILVMIGAVIYVPAIVAFAILVSGAG